MNTKSKVTFQKRFYKNNFSLKYMLEKISNLMEKISKPYILVPTKSAIGFANIRLTPPRCQQKKNVGLTLSGPPVEFRVILFPAALSFKFCPSLTQLQKIEQMSGYHTKTNNRPTSPLQWFRKSTIGNIPSSRETPFLLKSIPGPSEVWRWVIENLHRDKEFIIIVKPDAHE